MTGKMIMQFQNRNQKPNRKQDLQGSDPEYVGTGNNDVEERTNACQKMNYDLID